MSFYREEWVPIAKLKEANEWKKYFGFPIVLKPIEEHLNLHL